MSYAVCTHSTPKTIFIFSAYNSGNTPLENAIQDRALRQYLTYIKCPFIVLEGCYKGEKEPSLLVDSARIKESQVRHIALNYRQETYLRAVSHKHGTYKAWLVSPETHGTEGDFIGFLREFSKADIDALGLDYSYRPDTGKFFAVWPSDNTIETAFKAEIKAAIAAA